MLACHLGLEMRARACVPVHALPRVVRQRDAARRRRRAACAWRERLVQSL